VSPLRIGTRGSDLALWQAEQVAAAIRTRLGRPTCIVTIATHGDRDHTRPIELLGTVGAFTKEIEHALRDGEVDVGVHSLKDLPTVFADGLALAAVPQRHDPRDLLLARPQVFQTCAPQGPDLDGLEVLAALRHGARVGTSSRRRRVQIRAARPDLVVADLRGNVPTRVEKLRRGDHDAIVLAAAGVERLGLALKGLVAAKLPLRRFLPAPGQGALAVEVRSADRDLLDALRAIDDPDAAACVRAERGLLRLIEGGCSVPLGAHAVFEKGSSAGRFRLDAVLGPTDDIAGGEGGPGVPAPRLRWARVRAATAEEAARAAFRILRPDGPGGPEGPEGPERSGPPTPRPTTLAVYHGTLTSSEQTLPEGLETGPGGGEEDRAGGGEKDRAGGGEKHGPGDGEEDRAGGREEDRAGGGEKHGPGDGEEDRAGGRKEQGPGRGAGQPAGSATGPASPERPLAGRGVVVLRPEDRAEEVVDALVAAGARAEAYPAIETRALAGAGEVAAALEAQPGGAWVLVSSPTAAAHLVARLGEAGLEPDVALGARRVGALGPGTAAALGRAGVAVDLVGEGGGGKGFAEAFLALGDRPGAAPVLVPAARDARPDLRERLAAAGHDVRAVALYEAADAVSDATVAALAAADAALFASPSAIRAVLARGPIPPHLRIVAIGPTTAAEARARGLEVAAEAERPTPAAVVAAVIEALSGARGSRSQILAARSAAGGVGGRSPPKTKTGEQGGNLKDHTL